MKNFINTNFLLQSKTAEKLYHDYASPMPIYDYHSHLPPKDIAEDRMYENIAECWLSEDHYKWRAMRANGIEEKYITGDAPWYEKFKKWAETVPYLLRNPLYHWTHLELKSYFDIDELLSPETALDIYEKCNSMLKTKVFSVRNLLKKMNVDLVCTTDDPLDSLEYHKKIAEEDFLCRVLPTFRPDNAVNLNNPYEYSKYIKNLEKASDVNISGFVSLLEAVKKRHDYFHLNGCRMSDHDMMYITDTNISVRELDSLFSRAVNGKSVSGVDLFKFKSVFLYEVCKMNHEKKWTQQIHIGVFRNTNSRSYESLGRDTGFDSISDYQQGPGLKSLFDRLDKNGKLSKTVLYNINLSDNELIASMAGNFQDSSAACKIQMGPAWWFLDNRDGIENHLNTVSRLGLLSRFIGMVTDSRSFLSFPRHEYFRRILCNLIGDDVEKGLLPSDFELTGRLIENICYKNAAEYLRF